MIITVTEYAKQTGTSRQAVYKKINAGKLKTIKTTDKNGREINCIELDEPIKESPKTRQGKPQEAPGARENDFIIKTEKVMPSQSEIPKGIKIKYNINFCKSF